MTSANFRPVSFLLRRAFRLYPLWIETSFIFLWLTNYIGRSERQTDAFFNWSLTLLPTNGMPFYDIGWSLQHEMLFYVLAAAVSPWLGIYGVAAVLALGVAADHLTELPWYLHQYFFYYGNFLAGIAAFLVHRSGLRPGFILPLVLGIVAFRWAPTRSLFPIALFCWLVGFVNLKTGWSIGRLGALLGDASYSIYLLHPLAFYWVYIQLQPPLPPLWTQELLRYGTMIAVCAAAITSWMLFERPMMYLGDCIDRYVRRWHSPPVLAEQPSE